MIERLITTNLWEFSSVEGHYLPSCILPNDSPKAISPRTSKATIPYHSVRLMPPDTLLRFSTLSKNRSIESCMIDSWSPKALLVNAAASDRFIL